MAFEKLASHAGGEGRRAEHLQKGALSTIPSQMPFDLRMTSMSSRRASGGRYDGDSQALPQAAGITI